MYSADRSRAFYIPQQPRQGAHNRAGGRAGGGGRAVPQKAKTEASERRRSASHFRPGFPPGDPSPSPAPPPPPERSRRFAAFEDKGGYTRVRKNAFGSALCSRKRLTRGGEATALSWRETLVLTELPAFVRAKLPYFHNLDALCSVLH